MHDFAPRVDAARESVMRTRIEADAATLKAAQLSTEVIDLAKRADLAHRTREVLAGLARIKQAEAAKRVEGLVTRALRTVFDRDYQFRFEWSERRGVVTAEPLLTVGQGDDAHEDDILTGHGGGVADVVSFVLRFIVIRYLGLRPFMALDEPFRHVSDQHARGIGQMLSALCRRTGFRLLLVTHQMGIAQQADRCCDNVLDANGRSTLYPRAIKEE